VDHEKSLSSCFHSCDCQNTATGVRSAKVLAVFWRFGDDGMFGAGDSMLSSLFECRRPRSTSVYQSLVACSLSVRSRAMLWATSLKIAGPVRDFATVYEA
jgi:hypothetical protein